MLHPNPGHDLTYNDVFMVPSLSDVPSRMDVDLTTPDGIGTTIPLVVSNMTAVAGRRMAETVARRGGVAILPQDIPLDVVENVIASVKGCHPVFETPITLRPDATIGDALSLIHKRAHGAVVVVEDGRPVGVFTGKDADGFDRFTQLRNVMSSTVHILPPDVDAATAHEQLGERRLHVAPVVDADERLLGVVTRKGALRSTIYRPALDGDGRLMVGVAVGINGDPAGSGRTSWRRWAPTCSSSTPPTATRPARCARSSRCVRRSGDAKIVAGNVVTADGTRQLLEAGADIVKVGVGPGAMCTTRMMTGVGRPQFSAVVECADEAARSGGHIWADGGVKFPRDVALALAGGAANVMVGSWLAGTYESAADTRLDTDGRLYKESFGMASNRAVKNRTRTETEFERARKELFEEGISTSRMYLDPGATRRRGHHRSDRRRAPFVVHLRRCGVDRPSSTSDPSSGCRAPPATTRAARRGCRGDARP